MKDLEVKLVNRPGALAQMGEILASGGISIEGGGIWSFNNNAIGHFLFEDGEKAKQILEENNIEVIAIHEVLIQKLQQDVPGQLGKFARIMEQNGVNIKVMYSDHYNQLILVVDDFEKGSIISQNWIIGLYQ